MARPFWRTRKEEILNPARRQEREEHTSTPLDRRIKCDERPEAVVIRSTDLRHSRSLDETLPIACPGKSNLHHDEEEDASSASTRTTNQV